MHRFIRSSAVSNVLYTVIILFILSVCGCLLKSCPYVYCCFLILFLPSFRVEMYKHVKLLGRQDMSGCYTWRRKRQLVHIEHINFHTGAIWCYIFVRKSFCSSSSWVVKKTLSLDTLEALLNLLSWNKCGIVCGILRVSLTSCRAEDTNCSVSSYLARLAVFVLRGGYLTDLGRNRKRTHLHPGFQGSDWVPCSLYLYWLLLRVKRP